MCVPLLEGEFSQIKKNVTAAALKASPFLPWRKIKNTRELPGSGTAPPGLSQSLDWVTKPNVDMKCFHPLTK